MDLDGAPERRLRDDDDRQGDEARFLKTWLERPLTVGAVKPSSKALAAAMARAIDPRVPGPVIELGPGTGPVTEALVRRGVAPHRLILVEFDPVFCALLARRYPEARVVRGDAYVLRQTLEGIARAPACAVVSSLPLLVRPEPRRVALLADALALLRPGAPFVQFTYGPMAPIPRALPGVRALGSKPVWLNLPPARVWVYRHDPAAEREARPARDLLDKVRAGTERATLDLRRRLKIRAEAARHRWGAREDAALERVRLWRIRSTSRLETALRGVARGEPLSHDAAPGPARRQGDTRRPRP